MSHSRSHDFLLLLAYGIPMACGPATEPTTTGGGGDDPGADAASAIAVCSDFAKQQTACFAEAEDTGYGGYGGYGYLSTLGYCISYLGYADYVGPACRGAMEDHFACLAELDCSELIVHGSGSSDEDDGDTGNEPQQDPCAMQSAALDAACEFGDDADVVTSGDESG